MRTLGTSLNDLDFSVAEGLRANAERTSQRLRFWLGTWYLDSRLGIPYGNQVFGFHPDLSLPTRIISDTILSVSGNLAVEDVVVKLDRTTRRLNYSARVICTAGEFGVDGLLEPTLETRVPSPPLLSVTPMRAGATLRWLPPSDDGGSPVGWYQYRAILASDTAEINPPWENAGDVTHFQLRQLTDGAEYIFHVRAVSAVGPGAIGFARATLPTPPSSVSALLLMTETGVINAAWSPPSDDGGHPVQSYDIRLIQGGTTGDWRSIVIFRNWRYSGLTSGLSYDVQVRAVNEIGAGPIRQESITVA